LKTKAIHEKINIITLGCSKNLVDSENLMGQLKINNFDVVHDSDEDADIVIINTCGFIDDAKEESINTILQAVNDKSHGFLKKVYVMGCLSERYKSNLENEISDVDGFFGVSELPEIIEELGGKYKNELIGERSLTTPSHYAYLKISEGCNRNCSFCAIPLIRGKHISRAVETIIKEANILAGKGVKELILIAQDLTYYGLDLYKERKLAFLLEELVKIESIKWIRLHYTYPSGFPEDVIEVIAKYDKICNYIDIPLQHISDNLLKSMKRNITGQQTKNLINKIRSKIPDSAVRTTLISGYPGETENDFKDLKEFIKEFRFERLGVFTYSHEEDTVAFELIDDVPAQTKQDRADEIMMIQQDISREINSNKIGKIFKVVIDSVEGDYYIGRTQFDSPEVDNEVLINFDNLHKIGEFYKVLITAAEDYDLLAKFI
jgi:ribosomal protein S12 methylthiotransferase